jgi:predicted nicotinamide N-methyase
MIQQSAPSPVLFFETVNAYQRTAAIRAALELDIFSGIAAGDDTTETLAARCGADPRGMRVLCDYLTVSGFLYKSSGHYVLTADSATFLDRASPAYCGGSLEFLLDREQMRAFDDLAAVVRKGGTVMDHGGALAPGHPMWVRFARAMAPMMALPAKHIAEQFVNEQRPVRVLDIAAGHGLFGIAVAKHNPQARVVALDWPNVLPVAMENAERAGVRDRYDTIAGSAFDADYGTGYDAILLTNFLHHFDPDTIERLLRKVRGALAHGGKVVALEFVPDDNRVSPPVPASFSLVMLASTPKGDAYTHAELDRMFRNAGFSHTTAHPLPPTMQQVIVGS